MEHSGLRCFSISSQSQKFRNWIPKLQNLRGLKLYFSRLINEPLEYLKDLPNLAYLHMYQEYVGEELHFEESSFRILKQLELNKLGGLKAVKIDEGALPLVEKLDIGPSPLMETLPDVQHLTNLKYVGITDMPREFVAGLQPKGCPHYWKIQHVPSVKFWYKNEGIIYDNYKLGSSALSQLLQNQQGKQRTFIEIK